MTPAELAILGLLAEQPRHGYGIEQVIDERGMREWTAIGFSSIYYVLKKLEQPGWIESHPESRKGPGPTSKIYVITQTGLLAWHEAILHALRTPQLGSQLFLLALANLPLLDPAEVDHALGQYEQALSDRRDQLRTRLERDHSLMPLHVRGMFDLSLHLLDAERTWLVTFHQEFLQQVNQEQVESEQATKNISRKGKNNGDS